MQNFTGMEYLYIAVANHFGLDKSSWEDRIQWTKENNEELENLVFQGADEPAEMLGAVSALRKAEKGLPIGFPIGLDATTSCIQIMACLTNDEKAMQSCNVIGTGRREDAYQIVYDDMCEQLETKGDLKRIQIKEAIMTGVYGSLAKPKEIFGDKTPEYYQFSESMNYIFPRVWKLREMMLNRWNPKVVEYNWILPDNFHVHIPVYRPETLKGTFEGQVRYFNQYVVGPTPKGRSLGANLIHSVDAFMIREIVRRTNYDPEWIQKIKNMNHAQYYEDENTRMILILLDLYKKSGMLSQRILDYIRPYNLDILPEGMLEKLISRLSPKPFKMLTIHDCFRVHANYANELRKQYIELLAELTESDILDFLCMQINSFKPAFRKVYGLGEKIRKTSEYALS